MSHTKSPPANSAGGDFVFCLNALISRILFPHPKIRVQSSLWARDCSSELWPPVLSHFNAGTKVELHRIGVFLSWQLPAATVSFYLTSFHPYLLRTKTYEKVFVATIGGIVSVTLSRSPVPLM